MALSGQLVAVTNRSVESCWLFLAHVGPEQIVLTSLGGSCGPRLAVTNPTAELSGSFLPTLGRNKSYCLGGSSGPHLAVTNRIAESWWLFLAHVWP